MYGIGLDTLPFTGSYVMGYHEWVIAVMTIPAIIGIYSLYRIPKFR